MLIASSTKCILKKQNKKTKMEQEMSQQQRTDDAFSLSSFHGADQCFQFASHVIVFENVAEFDHVLREQPRLKKNKQQNRVKCGIH